MHQIWEMISDLEICEVVETKVMEGDDGWTLEVLRDIKGTKEDGIRWEKNRILALHERENSFKILTIF